MSDIRHRSSDTEAPALVRRACLGCGRIFLSDGPHNRVCDGCKETETWRAGAAGQVQAAGRGRALVKKRGHG